MLPLCDLENKYNDTTMKFWRNIQFELKNLSPKEISNQIFNVEEFKQK